MTVDRETTYRRMPQDSAERAKFQALLDTVFPIGATCAVIRPGPGHLDEVSPTTTGRLVCVDSEEDERRRRWYQVVVDPREASDHDADIVTLWIGRPQPLESIESLWQAEIRSDEMSARILRLNAQPPSQSRPTPAMREAVTEAYSDVLSSLEAL